VGGLLVGPQIIPEVAMKSDFVSLGSACDVGIALQWMRLKKCSFPFDWLWNLDGGLSSVIRILEGDFKTIDHFDCYEIKYSSSVGRNLIVYTAHPEVMHLHSNPMEHRGEHETLVRRINRLRAALADQELFLNFVYYRNFESQSDQVPKGRLNLIKAMEILRDEGHRFMDFMEKKYPLKQFSITLVMQTSKELMEQATPMMHQLHRMDRFAEMRYGFVITRPDEDQMLKALWRVQWCEIVLRCCRLSIFHRICVSLKWIQQFISYQCKRVILKPL
jgi:hypothetical protein